ncbi:MAG: UDP-hydrolyzing UDP-N-acetyl-D-glucosamine 2-epimerase [Desulforhopalus sp.]|jgi:UDP-hydrolysing UDP-N-acetyl-D-glucosamine 2-epimerase
MRKKICVITGTRAEYGLLYWLLKEIEADEELILQLIVTGSHLCPSFGETFKDIEKDGFKIDKKVELLLSSDTPSGTAKSLGLGIIGFSDALSDLTPDVIVILGDRFEMLAAAQTALILNVPIAHIHGGETTEGAFDEAIRHSITKMSHLHFVAANEYRMRVIQLGEHPDRVLNYGAPGLDHLTKTQLLEKNDFEKSIDFKLSTLNFLVTFHPETYNLDSTEASISSLLDALDEFPDARIIFTGNNSDPSAHIIYKKINQYVKTNSSRCIYFTSLGQKRYLSALQHITLVIGNSSSGLSEVPSFKKPTVNIGNRQKGRLKASSVLDCIANSQAITASIRLALSSEFQKCLSTVTSPYGMGNVSEKIKNSLKSFDLNQGTQKIFYDIPFTLHQ